MSLYRFFEIQDLSQCLCEHLTPTDILCLMLSNSKIYTNLIKNFTVQNKFMKYVYGNLQQRYMKKNIHISLNASTQQLEADYFVTEFHERLRMLLMCHAERGYFLGSTITCWVPAKYFCHASGEEITELREHPHRLYEIEILNFKILNVTRYHNRFYDFDYQQHLPTLTNKNRNKNAQYMFALYSMYDKYCFHENNCMQQAITLVDCCAQAVKYKIIDPRLRNRQDIEINVAMLINFRNIPQYKNVSCNEKFVVFNVYNCSNCLLNCKKVFSFDVKCKSHRNLCSSCLKELYVSVADIGKHIWKTSTDEKKLIKQAIACGELQIIRFYDTFFANIYKYAHARYVNKIELASLLGYTQIDESFLIKTTNTSRDRKMRFADSKFAECKHPLPNAFRRL
jgi:hypothetical protein